jgi:pimeloyl-ACP methyl ester carboxylesterase
LEVRDRKAVNWLFGILVEVEKTCFCPGRGELQGDCPDQRGYNLSDEPKGVRAYCVDHLVEDILGLINALYYEKVNIVEHDWGAAIAWMLAIKHLERLHRLGCERCCPFTTNGASQPGLLQGRQFDFFPDATHWVQREEVEEINHHLINFLFDTLSKRLSADLEGQTKKS